MIYQSKRNIVALCFDHRISWTPTAGGNGLLGRAAQSPNRQFN